MINIATIRANFPAFANQASFPDDQISFWLQVSNLLIDQVKFGPPAPYTEVQSALVSGGAGYAVNDKLAFSGGTYTQPLILIVDTVDGGGAILTYTIRNTGQYTVTPTNPISASDTTGTGTGATFTAQWQSGPMTACDLAIQLLTCHNLAVEQRGIKEAANGSSPGTTQGAISAKSVGGVSVSYDVAVAAIDNAGDWNLTIWGTRFAKLANMFGMGPVTIIGNFNGGPFGQGWMAGPGSGWNGPIYAQGIDWDC